MPAAQTELQNLFGKSYAFIIGIDEYTSTTTLKTAVGDAQAIAEKLTAHSFEMHSTLLNEQATKENIVRLISETIPALLQPNDRVIFYFAGHGIAFDSDADPKGFLVPVEGTLEDVGSLLEMELLKGAMDKWTCRHALLILDCCFAGAFRWSMNTRAIRRGASRVMYDQRFLRYAADPAWQVLVSSGADQEAIDLMDRLVGARAQEGHSPFAIALLEGLDGAADFGVIEGEQDGVVTATELYIYLRDRVQSMTENSPVKQTPGIFNLSRHDKGEFLFLNPKSPLNLPPLPDRNPYVGLSTFEEADALYFFGRDKAIEDLRLKVGIHPLVVVTGSSGTGKSSLVKAGLLPGLKKDGWEVLPVVRSGPNPLASLEAAIPNWREQLAKPNQILVIDQYEEAFNNGLTSVGWRQFEMELSALLEKEEEQLANGGLAAFRIIITIRSDYDVLLHGIDHPLNADPRRWWEKGRFLVPSFTPEELVEVIVKPANQAVLFFEPVDFPYTLVNDLDGAPGALSMLSYTLSSLYQSFEKNPSAQRTLLAAHYKAMGGVIGVLSNRADEVYNKLAPDLQPALKKIVLRMLKIENGRLVRRKVPILPQNYQQEHFAVEEQSSNPFLINELDFPEDTDDTIVHTIIASLHEAQLVVISSLDNGQSYLEPVHDAVINYWPKCLQWVHAFGPNNIVLQRSLWDAVLEFEGSEKNDETQKQAEKDILTPSASYLWDDNPKLQEVVKLQEQGLIWLNQAETDFIQKSLWRREDEIQKLKDLNEEAIRQRDEAILQKTLAERKSKEVQALALARMAEIAQEKGNPLCLNLATLAYGLTLHYQPAPMVTQIFLDIIYRTNPTMVMQSIATNLNYLYVSPSSAYLVTSYHKEITLWDANGFQLAILEGLPSWISRTVFDPLERFLAVLFGDYTLQIWDINLKLSKEYTNVKAFSWSEDGQFLMISQGLDGQYAFNLTLTLTKVEPTFQNWSVVSTYATVHQMLFSLKQHIVLQTGSDWLIQVRSLDDILVAEWAAGMLSHLSPDGDLLLCTPLDDIHLRYLEEQVVDEEMMTYVPGPLIQLWNIQGQLLLEQTVHDKGVITMARFSPDGSHILTRTADAVLKLWRLGPRYELSLKLQVSDTYGPLFSPDGQYLLTNTLQSSTLWEIKSEAKALWQDELPLKRSRVWVENDQIFIEKPTGPGRAILRPLNFPVFSPDGRSILFHNVPERFKIMDLSGVERFPMPPYEVSNIAVISADNQQLFLESQSNSIDIFALRDNFVIPLGGQQMRFKSILFSEDGTFMKAYSMANEILLFDTLGSVLAAVQLETTSSYEMVYSPDDMFFIAHGRGKEATIWRLDKTQITAMMAEIGEVQTILFSSNSLYFLAVFEDATAHLWKRKGNQWEKTDATFTNIKEPAFSPTGEIIVSIPGQDEIHLWNLKGELLDELRFYGTKGLTSNRIEAFGGVPDFQLVQFFDEDNYAVTSSNFGPVRIWGMNKQYAQGSDDKYLVKLETTLLITPGKLFSGEKFLLSPNGKRLLTFANTGLRYQLFDLEKLEALIEAENKTDHVNIDPQQTRGQFNFSPDGQLVYGFYENGQITLWQPDGTLYRTFSTVLDVKPQSVFDTGYEPRLLIDYKDNRSSTFARLSPDNSLVLTYSKQLVQLWDLDGNKLADLDGHERNIKNAGFSPDNRFVLTQDEGGGAKLWPLPTTLYDRLSTPGFLPEMTVEEKTKYGLQ
ncbi:MAG: caspase family protein [Saprospiraceae bacterium]